MSDSNSTTGKLDIVLDASATKVEQEVDKVNAKLDQMVSKAQSSAQAMAASNQGTVESLKGVGDSVQRAAGAIDSLGSHTDDLTGKQHTAWLAIGSIVGGTTQGMIQKITSLIDAAGAMPAALDAGFRAMSQASWTATDALRVTNDELENQIAILEKKPQNNVALEFDETRVKVDRLVQSIQQANEKTDQYLSKAHVAGWKRIIGQAPTANVEGTVGSFDDQIADLAYRAQVAMHNGDGPGAADLDKQRREKLAAAHQKYQEMLRGSQDSKFNNNATNRSMLSGADSQVMNAMDDDSEGDRNKADKAQLKRDQDAERAKLEAAAAKAKADAAAAKAAATQMQQFRQELSGIEQNHKLAIGEELAFWEGKMNATKEGSTNWLAINEKLGPLYQQMIDKLDAQMEKAAEDARKRASIIHEWDKEALRLNDELERAQHRATDNVAEYGAANQKNVDALQEMQVAHDVATGAISKYDAAVQMAALHSATYSAALKRLDDDRKADLDDASLSPEERDANEKGRAVQRVNIQGEADRATVADNWAIDQQTTWGAAKSAIETFVASTRDGATQIKELFGGTLSNLNHTIVEDLTSPRGRTPRHLWTDLGKDTAKSTANVALTKGEGVVAGLFGVDKLGTKANPMHVINDAERGGILSQGGAGLPPAISQLLPNLGGDTAGGTVAKFFSSIGDVASFLPGFADGTDSAPGGWSMVGERGPEPMFVPKGAQVVPHNKMDGMFGGDTHHHYLSIDARGATDPAQVHAQIMATVPHLIAASRPGNAAYAQDQKRRSVSGR